MTTADHVLGGGYAGLGLLDRERIIASAGFNRWLVPPAALCIHLCIGMAYGFSVFWLPLSRSLGPQTQACPNLTLFGELFTHDVQLARRESRLDVHAVLRAARHCGCDVGRLARARRAAQGRCRLGVMLVRRPDHRSARRLYASALADVARLRRARRHRARPRLHLAGLDPGEMVSRPTRHGDRHGDHGLRRRCHDRRAARGSADELLQDSDLGRRVADADCDGRHLLRLHDHRRASAIAFRRPAGARTAGRRRRPRTR